MRTVAIVGRPNVGKSALFNRLAGASISIVHDQAGVTRDRISATCSRGAAPFEIIDTGGIGAAPDAQLAEETHFAAEVAIAAADLLILVVDAQSGMTPVDLAVAGQLRKAGKPVIVAANKVDHGGMLDQQADFASLGFDPIIPVSAAHGRNVGALVEAIEGMIDLETDALVLAASEAPRIAIVGRPNVGKSSLINAILGEKRTIVSASPGTTRDAVDIPHAHKGSPFVLVDTAGIRHRSRHNTSVEVFSVMRSEKAIARADLNILVIDAMSGATTQDKKIGGLIQKARKASVIVLNKWDLVRSENPSREYLQKRVQEIREELFFLDYAPVVVLSARTRENLFRLLNTIEKVRQHASRKIGTGELNRILKRATERQPPPGRAGARFKILYATQLGPPEPRPFQRAEFLAFVNDARKLPAAYAGYLAASIRKEYEYPGLPVVFRFRSRKAD